MGAIVARLTEASGRVDPVHRYLLVVRGTQTPVLRAVEEIDRHARPCWRDVAPEANGKFVGKVDFVPYDAWVRRGGSFRELANQLRFVAPGLTEISLYLTDAELGFGVSLCTSFPVTAAESLQRNTLRLTDTVGRVGGVALDTADRTANAAANLAEGLGRSTEQATEGLNLFSKLFALTGPLGGMLILGGAAWAAVKFKVWRLL